MRDCHEIFIFEKIGICQKIKKIMFDLKLFTNATMY